MLSHLHCCEMMTFQVRRYGQCAHGCTGEHDCPDCLVCFTTDQSYGLLIHDGSTSFVQIAFCPWCAQRLPGGQDVDTSADGHLPEGALSEGGDPGRRLDLG